MGEFLFIILVVLVVARIAGSIARKLGQLPILGELIAGVVLGVITLYGPFSHYAEIELSKEFKILADLGIFFLMLMAGMEIEIKELVKASKAGLLVAFGGVVLPIVLGVSLGMAVLPASHLKLVQCLFLGVVLSITAIPALSRVLIELDLLKTRMGHTLISAAIIDDIIGLLLLSIVMGLMKDGAVLSLGVFGLLLAKITVFFIAAFLYGRFIMPLCVKHLSRLKIVEVEFSFVLVSAFAMGLLAEYAHMHFIIGALVTGMLVNKEVFSEGIVESVKQKLSAVTLGFFAPLFFVFVGLHVDIGAIGKAPLFAIALLFFAIIGKVVGAGVPARMLGFSWRESISMGFGMNGRGAVELVVAAVALEMGLFTQQGPVTPLLGSVFSSIIIMTIITTLLVPFGMKLFLPPAEK
ncbi:MAG: cation:proton antiporter [Candidatus Ancaeobacter aquaticus]|nr:cation:proton antiporter [Candidatus Ancaeobacter aquaticus]